MTSKEALFFSRVTKKTPCRDKSTNHDDYGAPFEAKSARCGDIACLAGRDDCKRGEASIMI